MMGHAKYRRCFQAICHLWLGVVVFAEIRRTIAVRILEAVGVLCCYHSRDVGCDGGASVGFHEKL